MNPVVSCVYIRLHTYMAEKTVKSVRLSADVAREVEEYAEKRDLSESDALRRLVEQGLAGGELEERLVDVERRLEHLERPFWERWL